MNDSVKKKILWVRSLLKKNAPSIFFRFYAYKLNKLGTEQVRSPDASHESGSPTKRNGTGSPIIPTQLDALKLL